MRIEYIFSMYWRRSKHVHFFNTLAIYWCKYLSNVDREYWRGFNRKKIFQIGRLSIWIKTK